MTQPIIRSAIPGDAAQLAGLAESTFRATFGAANTEANLSLHCESSYGAEIQLAEITDPQMHTFVAEDNNSLAAYAQVRRSKPPQCVKGQFPIEIQRLYVNSSYHGRGLAQALMAECLAYARSLRSEVVWLGVWEHNPRAVAFYRKCRFVEVGEHIFRLGDDPQRDIIMAIHV